MKCAVLALGSLVLVGLLGCGGGSPAVGTWSLDGTATLEANSAMMEEAVAGQPPAAVEMARQMMKGMFEAMEVTMVLNADGSLTGVSKAPNPLTNETAESKTTGTWSLEGTTVTMTAKDETSGKEETITATLEGDKMTSKMEQGGQKMTVIFLRKS